MRPRHDVAHPEADPTETIHFLRNSNNEWQATALRIARQRDEAQELAEHYRVALSTIDAIRDARDCTAPEALDAIFREVERALRRVPDGSSQVAR